MMHTSQNWMKQLIFSISFRIDLQLSRVKAFIFCLHLKNQFHTCFTTLCQMKNQMDCIMDLSGKKLSEKSYSFNRCLSSLYLASQSHSLSISSMILYSTMQNSLVTRSSNDSLINGNLSSGNSCS